MDFNKKRLTGYRSLSWQEMPSDILIMWILVLRLMFGFVKVAVRTGKLLQKVHIKFPENSKP